MAKKAKKRARAPTISPSQMRAMACRLQWHLGYRQGYRLKRVNASLDLGTGIHRGLEAYYGQGEDPVEAFQAWADQRLAEIDPKWQDDLVALEEIRDLGVDMLTNYLEEYADGDDFEVLTTEHTLRRKIPNPTRGGRPSRFTLVARLDGLVRDHKTGRLFSLEHKTYSNRPNAKALDQDSQFTIQVLLGQRLAEQMGIDEEVVGVIYNGLRKQKKTPRVKTPLFHRERIYRTDHQLKVEMRRAYWMAYEHYTLKPAIYPQPEPTRCNMCDFQDVCIAYMRGEDPKQLLELYYDKRGG